MNNRGFTIVELVAILLILAAISLVSYPLLRNLLRSDNDKQYNNMIDNLCLAGKSYIYANEEDFNNLNTAGVEIIIDINELIVYGSVKSDIKNPKTKKSINSDSLKFTVLDDYSLGCKYIEN